MKSRTPSRAKSSQSRPAPATARKKAVSAAKPRRSRATPPPAASRTAPPRRAEVKRVHIPLPKSPLVMPTSPTLALYVKAMASLQKGDYEAAAKKFEGVVHAREAEPVLSDRARVYIDLCHRKEAEESGRRRGEDLYASAVFEKNRGDLDASLELVRRLLKKGDDEKVHHLAASIFALRGVEHDAIDHLKRALRKNPSLIFQVRNDPDFRSLLASPAYRALEGASRKS